jgi:hypothetical protein
MSLHESPEQADWDAQAREAADYIADRQCSNHHGALPCSDPTCTAIYGNGGYYNIDAAQITVGLLRQDLAEAGLQMRGFGLDRYGETWVLLVKSRDIGLLEEHLNRAWQRASENDLFSLERHQRNYLLSHIKEPRS